MDRPSIRVNQRDKAIALIGKELRRKKVSYSTNEVESVVDELYRVYEEKRAVPTRAAFAGKCSDETVADTVRNMKRDPFTRRGKKRVVAAVFAGLALAAVVGGAVYGGTGGDETLTGEAGTRIAEQVEANCKANPNMDDETAEAVEDAAEEAAESAASDETEAKTGEGSSSSNSSNSSNSGSSSSKGSTSSGNKGSGSSSSSSSSTSSSGKGSSSSSGSSSNSSSSTSTHTHNWVAQTKTVHHDAVYKTVHHDAVTSTVVECNHCGTQFSSTSEWATHSKELLLGGYDGTNLSYSVKTVVTQEAYDEQVLVSAAYDETVTTGYKCSSCGATK